MMKLLDILLLGLSAAFIIIGIDQLIVLGFMHAYWAFMVALVPFFLYGLRRSRNRESNKEPDSKPATKAQTQKAKKR